MSSEPLEQQVGYAVADSLPNLAPLFLAHMVDGGKRRFTEGEQRALALQVLFVLSFTAENHASKRFTTVQGQQIGNIVYGKSAEMVARIQGMSLAAARNILDELRREYTSRGAMFEMDGTAKTANDLGRLLAESANVAGDRHFEEAYTGVVIKYAVLMDQTIGGMFQGAVSKQSENAHPPSVTGSSVRVDLSPVAGLDLVISALKEIDAQRHDSFVIGGVDLEHRNYFAQFMADGSVGLSVEVVGNTFLAPADRISEAQKEQMRSRGWQGDGSDNWSRRWPDSSTDAARRRIAHDTFSALNEVYGASGNVRVEINLRKATVPRSHVAAAASPAVVQKRTSPDSTNVPTKSGNVAMTEDFPEFKGTTLRRASVGRTGFLVSKETIELQFNGQGVKLYAQKCPIRVLLSINRDDRPLEIELDSPIRKDFGEIFLGSEIYSASMIMQEPSPGGAPLSKPVKFVLTLKLQGVAAAVIAISANIGAASPGDAWEARLVMEPL